MDSTNTKKTLKAQGKPPGLYAWSVFVLSAAFLFYQYLAYIAPAVVTDQLIKTHALSGLMLGVLVSLYFYSYLLMQIPAALLMDRYGAQIVTSLALFICALGLLLFSSTSLGIAMSGRVLIGIGAAFAALSYMKLASIWFPTAYFPLIASFFGIACMAGAGTAETPLAWLSDRLGWHQAFYVCAAIGLSLSIIAALLLRSKRAEQNTSAPNKDHAFHKKTFILLLRSPYQWSLMLYSGLAFTPIAVFAGLWGTPYLMEAYGLSKFYGASSVSFAFFGFVCGGMLIDPLAKRLKSSLPIMVIGTLLALILLSIIVYLPYFSYAMLTLLIFCFGVCSSSYLATYALARDAHHLKAVSSSVVLINMAGPLLAAIAEPIIGQILDFNAIASSVQGVNKFSTHGYQMGLSLLIFYLILALASCYLVAKLKKNIFTHLK